MAERAGKSYGMIAQLNRSYITSNPAKVIPRLISYFLFEGRPATTKGRWFNPITFRSLNSASSGSLHAGAETPVFITGTGRSGSTILGMVLSAHREAGFLNEPKALWYLANPADDLIGSYSSGAAKYLMDANDANESVSRKVRSMYSSFLRMTGSSRIIDKFPEMIFRVEYLNQLFADPKYIFLYRNAKETIASTVIWSDSHRDETGKQDWWGVENRKWKLLLEQVVPHDEYLSPLKDLISDFTLQSDMATVEWIATMNQGLKMCKAYPDKVMPVSYESLAAEQEKVLDSICRFTGLQHDGHFIRFGAKTIKASGNGVQVEIHPKLAGAVAELSEKLGYKNYSPSISVTE